MSERKQPMTGTSFRESERDAREAKLRGLYAAAYPEAYAAVEPSEALEQRIAALAARHDAEAARRSRGWSLLAVRMVPAMGAAVALLLLAMLGLTLLRQRDHDRSNRLARLPQREQFVPVVPRTTTSPGDRQGSRHHRAPALPQQAGNETPTGAGTPPATREETAIASTQHPAPSIQHAAPIPGDLKYVNGDPVDIGRQWAWVPRDEWARIEANVRRTVHVRDNFLMIPFPRIAGSTNDAIAAAVDSYKREAAVIDPRLSREVTLAFKAAALSDVCDRLRSETGIQLAAGNSIADEKVTVFCEKLPLRDVMRQLSRPFGYAWLRSRREGEEYRYELVQDLKSQLLEEDLRNRDRNEALLALDREMNRYRQYLSLSPDEALARARTASPEEKKLLEHLATDGWGLVHMWFRLSPQQLNALRSGARLIFSQEPRDDQMSLPEGLARGTLESQRQRRIFVKDGRYDQYLLRNEKNHSGGSPPVARPDSLPPSAVPAVRAMVEIRMSQSELGTFALTGGPGIFISADSPMPGGFSVSSEVGSLAVGISPSVQKPDNTTANARFASDPALRRLVTIEPRSLYGADRSPSRQADLEGRSEEQPEPKVTSADVLEALHRATGMPVVADFYTRLYPTRTVTVKGQPLFQALNRLADAMHLRWDKEAGAPSAGSGRAGAWLEFRSTSFFNDRLKEVPNRLLARWSASRRQHGILTLDDLIEIAALTDAQLDAADMAEGAWESWGLAEWGLATRRYLRPHLRYLAGFTPDQRREARSASGLSFTKLSSAQQQKFLSFALLPGGNELSALQGLSSATLKVDYSHPGEFEWAPPDWRHLLPSPVREPNVEAALQAARRIDPMATAAQIAPTPLDLVVLYSPSGPSSRYFRIVRTGNDGWVP